MSPLFENAIDSLKVGMKFFIDDTSESSNKHAILAIYHSIELFLKEALYRVHPILIYRNIDKKISDDLTTVGLEELFARFNNLEIRLSREEESALLDLRKKRNRIEHHKYTREDNDEFIIGKSLNFIIEFLLGHLGCKLEDHIEGELYAKVLKLVMDYNSIKSLVDLELGEWIGKEYPADDITDYGQPGSFPGTLLCPYCKEEYLVMDSPKGDYCFFCRMNLEVLECSECGMAFKKEGVSSSICPECEVFLQEKVTSSNYTRPLNGG